MVKTVPQVQKTDSWLQWRRGKISATMIAPIMGLHPKKSALMLYDEINSGHKEPVNDAMQRGIDKEPDARKCIERHFGVSYPEACVEHETIPYFIASLDGYCPSAKVKIVEIKVLGATNHQSAKLGVVPSIYFCQCQWQLYVANVEMLYYVSYQTDSDYEIIAVKRDDAFIEKAKIAAEAFYRNLVEFIPPEPTDMDLEVLHDPASTEAVKIIESANMIIKQQENMIEEAKSVLKKNSNGRSCKIGDHRFVKYMRKGNIDTARLAADANLNVEDYRKGRIESWRFT